MLFVQMVQNVHHRIRQKYQDHTQQLVSIDDLDPYHIVKLYQMLVECISQRLGRKIQLHHQRNILQLVLYLEFDFGLVHLQMAQYDFQKMVRNLLGGI